MKFNFTEKKIKVSEELREYAEKKIGKLDRFFKLDSEAFVTFSCARGRYIVEVTLKNDGRFFRVSDTTNDMFASIDSAVAAIERQIRKNKSRLGKQLRAKSLEKTRTPSSVPSVANEEYDNNGEEFNIVRSKMFSIKPMTPEEAVLQMNLLEHEFFVFKNQNNNDAFSIVYKRKQGDYGLIETK
ncbi:MAG: ribosome-associated translation inhibitor RaiA [Oscillospiraceae bacterium]|jgi:putative sigma-54 modulation protein|nr:ribosome-associated translation inhibitor RaiA [Oscillospiraceae bacterium]